MENITAGEAPVLNPNDAPAGHVAVEALNCTGCAFFGRRGCSIPDSEIAPACSPVQRGDGKSVIFVPETSAPATLLHPMGSMGEAV